MNIVEDKKICSNVPSIVSSTKNVRIVNKKIKIENYVYVNCTIVYIIMYLKKTTLFISNNQLSKSLEIV